MKKGLFLVVVIPLLIFCGLRRNSAPFFSTQKYHCVCPEGISQDYFASISAVLAEKLKQNCAASQLILQLKEQFPVLNKIVVSYKPSIVHVALSAHEPICCINDHTVLASNQELFSKKFFSKTAVDQVPSIAVFQDDMATVSFFVAALLSELPLQFNDTYDLEFMNEHYVRLVDKQQPRFIIALTGAQKQPSQLLAQCEKVKKDIAARAGFDKGITWIADTRFADYIVAYKA